MLRFCEEVANYQIQQGRYVVLEDPKTSAMWKTTPLVRLEKQPGAKREDLDMCRHGLKDPASKLPMRKSTCLMHNLPNGALDLLFVKCTEGNKKHHQEHEPMEGSAPGHSPRTKFAQAYPKSFSKT